MKKGQIVLGALAPHPPHLVYAENPAQNEPKAECGWETLRWGYEALRKELEKTDYDVIIVHSPHWRTRVGHHFLALPEFKSLSVDPIFPNLFRFHYDLKCDVELAETLSLRASEKGLETKLMKNPDFRVDYGTIISCHLANPLWNKPIVLISSNSSFLDYSNDYGQEQMLKLGEATRSAVEELGRKALVLASCSLSHRHFTTESPIPEDMSREHISNYGNYLWDMRLIQLMKEGKTRELFELIPDFTEQTVSEFDSGSMSWLIGALDFPDYPAKVHAYGTVIGTGNAVVSWSESDMGARK